MNKSPEADGKMSASGLFRCFITELGDFFIALQQIVLNFANEIGM